jgi:uncharacterized membrane protein
MQIPNQVKDHVETIAKHEQEFLASRSRADRLSDSVAIFAGSLSFVVLHLAIFLVWIILNTGFISRISRFDPYPFPLLDTCVALEAILLASFILMRQSRLAKRADEREHLMLQILLLTEKEVSAVIRINQQIAEQVGLHGVSRDPELKELGRRTSIDEVAQTIQENIASE